MSMDRWTALALSSKAGKAVDLEMLTNNKSAIETAALKLSNPEGINQYSKGDLELANPYHDEHGRFTSAEGARGSADKKSDHARGLSLKNGSSKREIRNAHKEALIAHAQLAKHFHDAAEKEWNNPKAKAGESRRRAIDLESKAKYHANEANKHAASLGNGDHKDYLKKKRIKLSHDAELFGLILANEFGGIHIKCPNCGKENCRDDKGCCSKCKKPWPLRIKASLELSNPEGVNQYTKNGGSGSGKDKGKTGQYEKQLTKATEAKAKADTASEKAQKSGNAKDHFEAADKQRVSAQEHFKAATKAEDAGDKDAAKSHAKIANDALEMKTKHVLAGASLTKDDVDDRPTHDEKGRFALPEKKNSAVNLSSASCMQASRDNAAKAKAEANPPKRPRDAKLSQDIDTKNALVLDAERRLKLSKG